jgi:radical SAM protein with 4Fe4S-binding SPASM domain
MNILQIYKTAKKATAKFILWEFYWAIRFLSIKKLANYISVNFQNHFKRFSEVRGFPVKLTIDLTANCNLHCPLCPTGQGDKTRKRGFMKYEDFKKLIDEIGEYLLDVDLFDWGEPLLNKEVFKMISYINRKRIKARISSNLNYFPNGFEKELVKSRLHHLVVSLDGVTQESYSQYRVGGSLLKVVEAVKRINQEKKWQKSPFPFITWQFIVMKHNEHEIERAKKLVKAWGFDRIVFQRNRGNMGNELFEREKKQSKTCNFLWNQSVINWNGSVSPCCFYYDEKYDFGNAFEKSFTEVWNNQKYQEARKLVIHKKSKDKDLICWNCIRKGFPA